MRAYHSDETLQDARTVRMEQRTTQRAKALIEQAAQLLGINASEFTVSAAVKAARETLKEYETTVLTTEDHAAFLRAWDTTKPTGDLVRLMRLRP